MAEQMFHREIPVCRVSVDGNPLAPEKQAALTRVTVDLDGDLFGQCSLHFNDPRLELIDGKEFGCGAAVKVELGFGSQKEQVFEGEVVSLMPQFRRDLPPFLRVVCLESVHRLALSPVTRAFNNVDDKQIATQIARDHGLTADAPSGTAEHVMQANVSDAVFLRRLAQKNGNNLRISGKQLVIGPPASGAQIQVGPASGVSRMRVKINAKSQVSEISVHAWDPAQKREIVGKAKAQGLTGEGSRDHGGGAVLSFAADTHPPADPATADAMAQGRMRKLAEGYFTAQVEMLGNPKIRPGAELSFEKLGAQMDGTWRVERAEHAFSKHGYFVKLRAARIAKAAAPKQVAPPPKGPAPQPQPSAAGPSAAGPEAIPGQRIEVKVLDPMGNPKPDFFFRLVQEGAPEQAGRTDAEGYIRMTLPKAGQWKLIFPDVDGSAQPQTQPGH